MLGTIQQSWSVHRGRGTGKLEHPSFCYQILVTKVRQGILLVSSEWALSHLGKPRKPPTSSPRKIEPSPPIGTYLPASCCSEPLHARRKVRGLFLSQDQLHYPEGPCRRHGVEAWLVTTSHDHPVLQDHRIPLPRRHHHIPQLRHRLHNKLLGLARPRRKLEITLPLPRRLMIHPSSNQTYPSSQISPRVFPRH